jgi:hypothetical protein
VDKEGHILGQGHATRDKVEWLIPLLWPIDILNLPRRGPTPVLRPETQLTLKFMEDIEVPIQQVSYEQVPSISDADSALQSYGLVPPAFGLARAHPSWTKPFVDTWREKNTEEYIQRQQAARAAWEEQEAFRIRQP